MNFDLNETNQASFFLYDIKASMYGKISEFTRRYKILGQINRFIGPITFCSSKVIDLVRIISSIFESIIKGLVNITAKQNFEKGLEQLFFEPPKKLFKGALIALIESIFLSIYEPLAMFWNPEKFSKERRQINFRLAGRPNIFFD